jgi:hypothetical protein
LKYFQGYRISKSPACKTVCFAAPKAAFFKDDFCGGRSPATKIPFIPGLQAVFSSWTRSNAIALEIF